MYRVVSFFIELWIYIRVLYAFTYACVSYVFVSLCMYVCVCV